MRLGIKTPGGGLIKLNFFGHRGQYPTQRLKVWNKFSMAWDMKNVKTIVLRLDMRKWHYMKSKVYLLMLHYRWPADTGAVSWV